MKILVIRYNFVRPAHYCKRPTIAIEGYISQKLNQGVQQGIRATLLT